MNNKERRFLNERGLMDEFKRFEQVLEGERVADCLPTRPEDKEKKADES